MVSVPVTSEAARLWRSDGSSKVARSPERLATAPSSALGASNAASVRAAAFA